jgi:hypothetical protein
MLILQKIISIFTFIYYSQWLVNFYLKSKYMLIKDFHYENKRLRLVILKFYGMYYKLGLTII